VAASVPVIVSPLSHCYLDVPYAEPSADLGQGKGRAGSASGFIHSRPSSSSFDWNRPKRLGPVEQRTSPE